MCFSASASFGAGIVLSTIGVIAIKKVETRSELFFASIPLIFSVQQISEGVLWLTLPHIQSLFFQRSCTSLFLFFAQVVWPLWVPLAILKLEKDERRKRTLRVLLGIGVLVSAYLAYCLFTFPVEASILGKHISYKQHYPASFSDYGAGLYIIATIVPPFFSSIKRMWFLGLAILFSYIITAIFYEGYIISVWCFFASVISALVLAIMFELRSLNKHQLSTIP